MLKALLVVKAAIALLLSINVFIVAMTVYRVYDLHRLFPANEEMNVLQRISNNVPELVPGIRKREAILLCYCGAVSIGIILVFFKATMELLPALVIIVTLMSCFLMHLESRYFRYVRAVYMIAKTL